LGQFPLPNIETLSSLPVLKTRIEKIMRQEGYQSGSWMYKGAKLCLIWPLWHKAFPNAKWIIVRRKTEDIIGSCINTGFMRAFSKQSFQNAIGVNNEWEGWFWWIEQHKKRFQEMQSAGLNIKEVWPDKMVSGNYQQIMKAIDWLGLEWNTDALSFVDPRLWKTRRKAV
jgi:hypothetical protein